MVRQEIPKLQTIFSRIKNIHFIRVISLDGSFDPQADEELSLSSYVHRPVVSLSPYFVLMTKSFVSL